MIDLEFNSHSQNPLQQSPPSIGGGLIDYFVFTIDKKYRRASTLEHNLKTLITHGVPIRGLCVIEAKTTSILLRHHIGRAVAEMHACGLHLGYTTIRGALTNGKSWIFLILTLDEKGGGGVWSASRHFDVHHDHHPTTNMEKVNEDSVNIIVGILAYWAEHCVESLTDDDWFEKTEDN
ncbi:hypothetical protein QCA50_003683 [Cerrena zonata]|uniref:Uncharacterized protein n=1 Tax=Cerrena zonata TaxID=2478898 RepID=A0AAW0GVI7_9APHY